MAECNIQKHWEAHLALCLCWTLSLGLLSYGFIVWHADYMIQLCNTDCLYLGADLETGRKVDLFH